MSRNVRCTFVDYGTFAYLMGSRSKRAKSIRIWIRNMCRRQINDARYMSFLLKLRQMKEKKCITWGMFLPPHVLHTLWCSPPGSWALAWPSWGPWQSCGPGLVWGRPCRGSGCRSGTRWEPDSPHGSCLLSSCRSIRCKGRRTGNEIFFLFRKSLSASV